MPNTVHKVLLQAFDGLAITTGGDLPGASGPVIDHIAHTADLTRASSIGIWPKRDGEDKPMSDHFGVWADFSLVPQVSSR